MTFFYIKHHDDQVATFNAKCQCSVLLNFIRKTLELQHCAQIDLIPYTPDWKGAAPLALQDKPEGSYASSFITTRAVFVVLQVSEDEEGVREYVPQWTKGDESDKLMATLEARTAEERKKASGAKSKSAPKK